MSVPQDIPDDLVALLGELQGIRNDPGRLITSKVAQRIQEMCHQQLAPDDPIRRSVDSQDLSQEVFLDLAEAASLFRGRTWKEFFAFVRKLIERRKIQQARQMGAEKRGGNMDRHLFDEESHQNDEATTPSRAYEIKDKKERLRTLIEKLPDGERTPLQMYLDKVPYPEIANHLGISQDAVRQRVSRALKRLRNDVSEL